MLWIPVTAAGVINGVGHYFGYRTYQVEDASTNIVPWGILIGGEELHNNHHAYASSAKLSSKWYEFDIGCSISACWRRSSSPSQEACAADQNGEGQVDMRLAKPFRQSLPTVTTFWPVHAFAAHHIAEELRRMREHKSGHAVDLQTMKRWLRLDATLVPEQEKVRLDQVLSTSKVLKTVYSMRQELAMLWQRSTANKERAALAIGRLVPSRGEKRYRAVARLLPDAALLRHELSLRYKLKARRQAGFFVQTQRGYLSLVSL
jgi:stearoyl-CoA desaturase (delta-9 desaturase)